MLKQRLQTGQHANAVDAFRSVLASGGTRALFAGTAATLAREVPFYAFGMVAYEQLKRAAAGLSGKELTPWQTIAVGAPPRLVLYSSRAVRFDVTAGAPRA